MPRKLNIGVQPKWISAPSATFATGTPSSSNLASSVYNPRGYALTYSVVSGSAPAGVTRSANLLQWDGRVTSASSTSMVFRFTSSLGSVDSPPATIAVIERHATVAWTAPTTNTAGLSFDGSSNDRKISKYRVYYGTNSTNVQNKTSSYVEVSGVASPYSPPATTYTFTGLTAGTWYFRVTAFDADGDESDVSPAGSKVIA